MALGNFFWSNSGASHSMTNLRAWIKMDLRNVPQYALTYIAAEKCLFNLSLLPCMRIYAAEFIPCDIWSTYIYPDITVSLSCLQLILEHLFRKSEKSGPKDKKFYATMKNLLFEPHWCLILKHISHWKV